MSSPRRSRAAGGGAQSRGSAAKPAAAETRPPRLSRLRLCRPNRPRPLRRTPPFGSSSSSPGTSSTAAGTSSRGGGRGTSSRSAAAGVPGRATSPPARRRLAAMTACKSSSSTSRAASITSPSLAATAEGGPGSIGAFLSDRRPSRPPRAAASSPSARAAGGGRHAPHASSASSHCPRLRLSDPWFLGNLPAFRFSARRARSPARLARPVSASSASSSSSPAGRSARRRRRGRARSGSAASSTSSHSSSSPEPVIVRRESQRGLGDPRRRNRGGRRKTARVREQRVDAARRGVPASNAMCRSSVSYPRSPRADRWAAWASAIVRETVGVGSAGVHGRQQEPFLRRAEGPAAETTAAAAARPEPPPSDRGPNNAFTKSLDPDPDAPRGSRGPEARVEAPGALEHGLGKHKLAIAIGRDAFAGESARLPPGRRLRRRHRQRGGVGVGAAPRFRLHDLPRWS